MAASTTPLTIHVGGDFRRDEGLANAALSPGHLVELISTGKWRKAAQGQGKWCEKAVAIEDALQGKVIADAYVADDLVSINIYNSGGEAFVFLSSGENVVIGDLLMLGTTAGELQKLTGTNRGIAIASEAKDLSGSGAVATKIRVRFI